MKLDLKNEVFISKEEFLYFVAKYKRSALLLFLIVFSAALLFLAIRPHNYLAKKNTSLPAQLEFLGNVSGYKMPIGGLSLLTSQQLLTEVIEETGQQIIYVPRGRIAQMAISFFEHMRLELGFLPHVEEPFLFSHVKTGQMQEGFLLKIAFHDDDKFDVLDTKKKVIGTGIIGEQVLLNDISFTLENVPKAIKKVIKKDKHYSFIVQPLEDTLSGLKTQLSIKPDRIDNATYHSAFSARNPIVAKRVLNSLFVKYEECKRRLYLDVLAKDIEEIQNQERSLRTELFTRLEDRAREYTSKIGEGQFIDAQSEIDILHTSKKTCLEKLLELEILLSRLEERNVGIGNQSIDLGKNIQTLTRQIESVDQIQKKLSQDPKSWHELYTFTSNELGYSQPTKLVNEEEVSRIFASQVISHLKGKKSLFEATSHAIEDEGQGKIDLVLGQNLLSEHYHKMFELESAMQQTTFLKGELLRPDFEISSVGSLLSDPFLQSLLKNTAELSFQLHDQVNHTSREQDRIRESIVFTKQFLDHHLRQKIDLLQLELDLTRLRAERIQQGMLEQIRSEKSLLEKRVRLVQQEVAELPNKWLLENYFEVESDLIKNLLKTFVSIEQSKILEKTTFHPNFQVLDPVFVLSQPQKRHTLVFSLMGGALFVMLYLSFQLAALSQKGFPISEQFLKVNHLKMLPEDLQQQALWLASSYKEGPLTVALFSDLISSQRLLDHLNRMGFQTTLCAIQPMEVGEKGFSKKIKDLRQNFDFILLTCDDLTTNIEKTALLKHCDLSLVFCRNQSTSDFHSLFEWALHKGVDHVGFAFKNTKAIS